MWKLLFIIVFFPSFLHPKLLNSAADPAASLQKVGNPFSKDLKTEGQGVDYIVFH